MRIKWGNIVELFVLICAIGLLFRLPDVLERVPREIHMPSYLDDPVYGLCFLGLLCITVVVIVKMFIDRQR